MSRRTTDPLAPYVRTWLALLGLLVLTVGISTLRLGAWNTVLSLAIAALKALLVGLVFMDARRSHRTVQLFTGLSVVWLAILVSLTLADLLNRGRLDAR